MTVYGSRRKRNIEWEKAYYNEKNSGRRAAVLCGLITLILMGRVYGAEFCFPDTEKGRLEAVKEYAVEKEGEKHSAYGISHDTPVRAAAFTEKDGWLYVFYTADNEENTHGILTLEKGINGKFRPIRSQEEPFPYYAGIWATWLNQGKDGQEVLALAGENCVDIKGAGLDLSSGQQNDGVMERVYSIDTPDFLWILDGSELWDDGKISPIFEKDVRFLDENGNDVTEKYRDERVTGGWGSGKGSAELWAVYVAVALIGFVGMALVQYFLWEEKEGPS